jgi:molybdopterin molybdotransferase
VGAATLTVFDRPRVAVLSTGDEVVPFDQSPTGAQVRNSNSIMLIALLRRLGCDVTDIGHARDEPKVIRERIAAGLEHDVLFVTGGMSMGRYDFVPRILHEMQAEMRITKLRIKPGKPFVFAALPGGPYVFGLPGNPVSGFVCTVRLASRLLARMSGGEAEPRSIEAKLSAALPANGPREFYQPAIFRGGEVEPLAWKGSADMFTLARANVLLVRAENEPALEMGSVVRVLEIPS